MAKAKTALDDETITPVQTFGNAGGDDAAAEIERLKAKIAEMEAAVANATATATEPTATGAPGKFLVKVQHGPSYVVEAASEHQAVPAYKAASGMQMMGYEPEVHRVGLDTPLGEWKG